MTQAIRVRERLDCWTVFGHERGNSFRRLPMLDDSTQPTMMLKLTERLSASRWLWFSLEIDRFHHIFLLSSLGVSCNVDGSVLISEMRHFNRLPQTWSFNAANNQYKRPISNTKNHSFKPKAIRIPALLSLFFLFTICLAWLEILIDRTAKPSEYYRSHGIDNGLKKRQAALSPGQCPAPEINALNLASLRSRHSELCSSYTTVFKPETTDLSPPMQTSFDQWLDIYSSMEALSELAESCALSQFSSSALSSLLISLTS